MQVFESFESIHVHDLKTMINSYVKENPQLKIIDVKYQAGGLLNHKPFHYALVWLEERQ